MIKIESYEKNPFAFLLCRGCGPQQPCAPKESEALLPPQGWLSQDPPLPTRVPRGRTHRSRGQVCLPVVVQDQACLYLWSSPHQLAACPQSGLQSVPLILCSDPGRNPSWPNVLHSQALCLRSQAVGTPLKQNSMDGGGPQWVSPSFWPFFRGCGRPSQPREQRIFHLSFPEHSFTSGCTCWRENMLTSQGCSLAKRPRGRRRSSAMTGVP